MAKPLSAYEAKRNFEKTAEPRGTASIRPAAYPRFVIQKHDATRLHYDLRLEVEGVFKSWAVTRGPSLDPNEKRLAVEVEDHPLDYGDFEGTIPKGEYGGGTVMVWDRGFWSSTDGLPAAQALRNGELKFVLAGSKLQGSWVLVRMKQDRTGGKRTNWLLIKHKDQWAKAGSADAVLRKDRSVATRRTMAQIAAGRGEGPVPFMMAREGRADPGDVWIQAQRAPEPQRRASPRRRPVPKFAPVKLMNGAVLGVTLTKPEKVLWPAEVSPPISKPVTKRQLVEYLATVGPWMIEHLRGCPCSVLRAPDGITRESFFQRHAMSSTTELVNTVKVSGDHEPYLQIDTVEGLVAMGQSAALEFHPWNCVPDVPAVPGRLVFDLDPAPDVAFSAVIDAAKEMRERLEALGLTAFCKTTGGKGLHVVAPLKFVPGDTLGWAEAKMFAEAVSAQMANDSPSKYLTKMTKSLRVGRIFLDYLRNDRMSTAVAPLSPRARPRATVSMPLTWPQVRSGLDPQRFTVNTVPALLLKTSAWQDYHAGARPLRAAIKRLVGTAR